MSASPYDLDHATLDAGSVVFKAKDGLKYSLRGTESNQWYLVIDERNGGHFRLGIQEASLLSLCNGVRSLGEIIAIHSKHFPDSDLDEDSAVSICTYLLETGIISTTSSRSLDRLDKVARNITKANRLKWLNPVALSIPLFNPDWFFERLNRVTRWIPGSLSLLIALLVIILGFIQLRLCWDNVTLHRLQAFSATDWLWMAVGWIVIKLLHEIGHGLVCKRLGGDVTQCGIVLFLFMPLPFVDCTSSWGFSRKRDRIAVASAGLIAELFLAAIGILLWSVLPVGSFRYQLEDVILATMVHTVLFNMNPLMKFDGYYILSDLLDLPNLSIQGRRSFNATMSKLFLDAGTPLPRMERHGWFVYFYGIASRLWIWSLILSIVIGASNLLSGVGLILGALALISASIPFVRSLSKSLSSYGSLRWRRIKRLSLTLTAFAVVLVILSWNLPAPRYVKAPVVFNYEDQVQVRSKAEGFLNQLHVQSGQFVDQGTLLGEIENPNSLAEIRKLESEIASEEFRLRTYLFEKDLAKESVAREKIASLSQQKLELEALNGNLKIYAPISGRVVSPNVEEKLGSFVLPGTEILSIANVNSITAIAMVSQSDSGRLKSTDSRIQAKVILSGVSASTLDGHVLAISPRATTLIHNKLLASPFGGPLEVVKVSDSGESNQAIINGVNKEVLDFTNKDFVQGMVLTKPRFEVKLSLEPHSEQLMPLSGSLAVAHIETKKDHVGNFAWNQICEWISQKLKLSHGL